MSVALAERKNLGGSCVNFGCTPTKAVIASARVAHQARRAPEYGLQIPEVSVDFRAVLRPPSKASGLPRISEGGPMFYQTSWDDHRILLSVREPPNDEPPLQAIGFSGKVLQIA